MTDPTNENPGAIPPAGVEPDADAAGGTTGGTFGGTSGGTSGDTATGTEGDADNAPTAVMAAASPEATAVAPASAAPAGAGTPPRQAWYRRRWAVITGAVAAALVLFLSGTAVGMTIGDGRDGRGEFRDGRGMFPGGGEGFGHGDWGDNGMAPSQGDQGMVPPGMDQGGQGFGHGGEDWDQDGDGYGRPQAPGTTPAPSASPQSLTQ